MEGGLGFSSRVTFAIGEIVVTLGLFSAGCFSRLVMKWPEGDLFLLVVVGFDFSKKSRALPLAFANLDSGSTFLLLEAACCFVGIHSGPIAAGAGGCFFVVEVEA